MPTRKIGILGGTGYTGVELLRILATHPGTSVDVITSRKQAGRPITELFPSLEGRYRLKFSDPEAAELRQCDFVFCAAPSGVAMKYAEELLDAGTRLIDLSADFRIRDIPTWEKWYGTQHLCPQLVENAVYGLTEVNRTQLVNARLVANPGCYATCIQLGFLPLVENDLIEPDSLIADAKSGVSGAGRKADLGTAFSEVSDSFRAYSASGHRHLPEIVQELGAASDHPIELIFTPHLLPINRGIFATLYARLKESARGMTMEDLQAVYLDRYQEEPFIQVMTSGSHPDVRSVRGSNHCRLALHRQQSGSTITVLAVEDNLTKGAAGQAVQNMNIMAGFPETMGLESIALVP